MPGRKGSIFIFVKLKVEMLVKEKLSNVFKARLKVETDVNCGTSTLDLLAIFQLDSRF